MEWRGESKLCLGDGDAGSRAKINSASLGECWGGRGKKIRSRPGRDQLLRCESFRPLVALSARASHNQPLGCTATTGQRCCLEFLCSPLQPCRGAKGFAMPVKPEAQSFLLQSRSWTVEWSCYFPFPLADMGSGFSQFSHMRAASTASFQPKTPKVLFSRSAIVQFIQLLSRNQNKGGQFDQTVLTAQTLVSRPWQNSRLQR